MSTTTTLSSRRPGAPRRDRLGAVPGAAAVYVAAWVVGLALPVPGLPSEPTAVDALARYTQSGPAVALQATLVHAVAGVALAILTVGLASLAHGWRRSSILAAGLGAAAVSIGQATLAVIGVARSSVEDAGWSLSVLNAVNRADVLKLVLLAVLVTSVTATMRQADVVPRWLVALGTGSAVLLVLGAASFLATAALLDAALVASLVVLLVWVGSVGVLIARHRSGIRRTTEEVHS